MQRHLSPTLAPTDFQKLVDNLCHQNQHELDATRVRMERLQSRGAPGQPLHTDVPG
jgi:hypothetical protein